MFKLNNLIVAILLTIGFVLRLYAANSVPLIGDEERKLFVAREISFNPQNLNLPIGSRITMRPLLSVYIIKIASGILGENKAAVRLPFIILSIISIYFIYKLASECLSRRATLLALSFLTFSQYHIGASRLIDENVLLLFFCSLSLYFFFRFLDSKTNKWLIFTSLALGIGYLGKELIILLLPVFFIFVFTNRAYRKLFSRKKKLVALGALVMLLAASPHIIWSIENKFYNFTYKHQNKIGLSLRSFYLYFADLPVILSKHNPEMFIWPPAQYRVQEDRERILRKEFPQAIYITDDNKLKIRMDGVYEYPAASLVEGIMVFWSVFYLLFSRKKKEDLIKFSLIMFLVVFIIPCLFDPSSLLAYHYWASMSFFPAAIIAGYFLSNLLERRLILGRICITIFIGYSIFNSLVFIDLPEDYFLAPKNEFYAYCRDRLELYRNEGRVNEAAKLTKWLFKNGIR